MGYINNYCQIAFNQFHFNNPEKLCFSEKDQIKVIVLTNSKTHKIAVIILSIFTLGLAKLIDNLYMAHRKVKKIEEMKLSVKNVIRKEMNSNETAITYKLPPGRLGDKLICFLNAYYVAYKNKIPFYYTPFQGSEDFNFSDILRSHVGLKFKRHFLYSDISSMNKVLGLPKNHSTLVTLKPFAQTNTDMNDLSFRKEIRKMFTLTKPLKLISLPKDRISIAMHMRMGGGFDSDAVKRQVPSKFPPKSFYEDGLQKMINSYGTQQKYYVHLFTDDKNPKKLVEELKQKFTGYDIEFGFREEGNSHDSGVLEDMYGMAKCKAMIRPWSGLSQIAETIGCAERVYEPNDWLPAIKKNQPLVVPGKLTEKK